MGDPEKAMLVDGNSSHEDEEEVDEGGETITAQMLKNPAVMAALQGKLDSMAGTMSGYIESLPAPVKKRLKALKKVQLETTKLESQVLRGGPSVGVQVPPTLHSPLRETCTNYKRRLRTERR